MEKIDKIKRAALVLFVVVSLILLYNIILASRVAFTGYAVPIGETLNPVKIVFDVIRVLIVLSILTCAMVLLRAIKKDETPFNIKNVKLLKSVAFLTAVLDPYEIVASRIPTFLPKIDISGLYRFELATTFLPSGCFFVAGIVVYCVSLIFKYGISLQKQFDETL